jgi:hypothetical protein
LKRRRWICHHNKCFCLIKDWLAIGKAAGLLESVRHVHHHPLLHPTTFALSLILSRMPSEEFRHTLFALHSILLSGKRRSMCLAFLFLHSDFISLHTCPGVRVRRSELKESKVRNKSAGASMRGVKGESRRRMNHMRMMG